MNGFIDITKCCSQNCKYKDTCYRVLAEANRWYQSWADFEEDCVLNNYRNFLSCEKENENK